MGRNYNPNVIRQFYQGDLSKKSEAAVQKTIACYSDSIHCATGFGQVARNILMGIFNSRRYNIFQYGINYWGDPHPYPIDIFPMGINGEQDPYGRKRFMEMASNMKYDLLFCSQDSFILMMLKDLIPEMRKKGNFAPVVAYIPVDGIPKPEWIQGVVPADIVVTYTNWGRQMLCNVAPEIEAKLRILPLGVNFNYFTPMPKDQKDDFRSKYFRTVKDNFIFTVVARNQQRKDLTKILIAFKDVKKKCPNSSLYMHMAMNDMGWNLGECCRSLGLDTAVDVIFPNNFNVNVGFPLEALNLIYNVSDCVVSSALGEGWGYCVHPDTNVYTEDGIKSIKDISISDKVLSSDGTYNEVDCITKRQSNGGSIFNIKTWLSNIPIRTSGDHGFFVMRDEKMKWLRAQDLVVGDILAFPKSYMDKGKEDINVLEVITPFLNPLHMKHLVECGNKFGMSSNFNKDVVYIPRHIKVTLSLMRLFGLYLAEGSINSGKMDGIRFSLNKKEKNLIDFIELEMKTSFGLDMYTQKDNRDDSYNGITLVFYSKPLAYFFKALFGSGARNKKIGSILTSQPKQMLRELLLGEFLGDGSSSEYELTFSTTSKNIAYTTRLLLSRLGILCSVKSSRTEYKISVTGGSREEFLKISGIEFEPVDRRYSNEKCFQNDSYLLLPIKSIEEERYWGDLIDISVRSTNNFVAENAIVHNSQTEAMATRTPTIMPNNTSHTEICGNGERGLLVKSGMDINHLTIIPNDFEIPRPMIHVDDLIEKMVWMYNNRQSQQVEDMIDKAFKWVRENLDWNILIPQWLNIFEEALSRGIQKETVISADLL